MGFRDDERGQAIQVGAVLLFAILIIAFSTYQAVIIPADNRRVEFNHNQDVQEHLSELRNAVVSTSQSTSARSVTVPLGTQFPSRTLGLNPPPPSGSLRTVGTADPLVNLSIRNATADGETGDRWNGSALAYNTGGIEYRPDYTRYDNAPATVYEHSVLYNRFRSDTLVLANQTVVDGNRISIVTVNGSLSRTSSAPTTVDVRPISSSSETILVDAQGPSSPITIEFTSQLSATEWQRILSDEDNVESVTGSPSPAGSEFTAIRVELNTSVEYRLQMTKAAVGQGATDEGPAYLTDVSGDDTSIQKGTSQQLTLAVRDRFNNPVSGITVNGSVTGTGNGGLDATTKTTGTDGRVTFTYSTTASTNTGEHAINFTTADQSRLAGSSFDATTTENVSMAVTVTAGSGGGGGGGAYSVDWTDPSGESTNGDEFGSCDNETCVWDVGAGSDTSLDLNATLDPVFEGIDVEFAVSNSTVGTLSPGSASTGSDGAAITTLSASENGTVDVLASANDGSDTITIDVENVSGGGGGGSASLSVLHEDLSNVDQNQGNYLVSYEVANAPGDFDKVAVHFINNDDSQDTAWRNSTSTADTVTYLDGDAGNDAYTIDVIAYDTGGNQIASWSVSDTSDGVNTGASDDLGDASSPTFTSFTLEDKSSNGNGMRYRASYTAQSSGFNQVEGYLIAQNSNSGEDSNTWTTTSTSKSVLSTYGFDKQNARQMKTTLLLYDNRGVVVDRVTWSDGADGSGTLSG